MIIPLLIVGFFVGLNISQKPPSLETPQEIAEWAKCDTAKIAWWIGQSIEYKEHKGWETAEACMERGNGDCKCMAVIAKDALNNCIGYDSRIATLKKSTGKLHAVALYTDHLGRKGYINSISDSKFDRNTDWVYVVEGVSPAGQWVEQ